MSRTASTSGGPTSFEATAQGERLVPPMLAPLRDSTRVKNDSRGPEGAVSRRRLSVPAAVLLARRDRLRAA